MSEVTARTREHAPWSISKAGIAEACPKQYAYKYIDKTPGAEAPSVNQVGNVTHAILEYRTGGAVKDEAYKLALAKMPLTSGELDSLKVLDESMEDFLRKWGVFCRTHEVVEILREKAWGLTLDFRPTAFFAKDVFFRGKLDLGALTKSGDLIVVDHKSGLAKDIQKDTKYLRQVNSYAVLARYNVEGLAGVRGGIHFMQGSESKRIQWFDYVSADAIEKRLVPWLYNYLNYVASRLVEPYEARPSKRWPCEWCNYKQNCEAYRGICSVCA